MIVRALEESGDIELLTRFVFRRALKQLGPLLREQRSFYVSVNVTGKDIADPGFIDFAMRQMARESVRPEQVALELTERTTEAQGCLLAGMNRLRELGLKIYVDDFGTGHSNLVYLANLPVDAIKIDKVFTQSIGDSSAVELIFDKLCSMAEHLEIGVVVEGIETQAQADHVLKCYRAVGFDYRALAGFGPAVGSLHPDSLAAELAFMAFLARAASEAAGDDPAASGRAAELLCQFAREHANAWLPKAARLLAAGDDDLYARAAALAADAVGSIAG